jgi:hypothetical protein
LAERPSGGAGRRGKRQTGKRRRKEKPGKRAQKRGRAGCGVSAGREKSLEDYQYNFTDPESRIMLTGKKEFEQCYNAQAAVDVDRMLIVGGYVTNRGNDKQELKPAVDRVDREVYTPETVVCADTGYYSEEAVGAVELRDETGECRGPEVYCAVEKQNHHKSVKDLEKQEETAPPAAEAAAKEKMADKLKRDKGKAIYKKRKETVEPVIINIPCPEAPPRTSERVLGYVPFANNQSGVEPAVRGFRQFLLRGLVPCLGQTTGYKP